MFRIREMVKEDCQAVHHIEEQCFSDPWSIESIEQSFRNLNIHYFVAVKNKKMVGFIGVLTVFAECDIINVAVLPEYSNQRIGRALVRQALEFLKEQGIETIYLEVRKSNEKAIALYQYFDFKSIGIRKQYYGNPIEDAIVMRRMIHLERR